MRRILIACGTAGLLALALASCSKKAEQASQTTTTSDSLLASSPVEQPAGNITPQSNVPPPTEQKQPEGTPAQPASSKPTIHTKSHSSESGHKESHASTSKGESGTLVAAGTPVQVSISTKVSSENANVGDSWTGEVKDNVIVGSQVVIPAGSRVEGVVNAVTPAAKGTRASLDLKVTSITVNGQTHEVNAGTEAIVAGSTRARNLGAIAGGAAAGALIGKAVGGGKGALIGGLIGAGGAGGAVAASKGYQVTVKEGTVITFTTSKDVKIRV